MSQKTERVVTELGNISVMLKDICSKLDALMNLSKPKRQRIYVNDWTIINTIKNYLNEIEINNDEFNHVLDLKLEPFTTLDDFNMVFSDDLGRAEYNASVHWINADVFGTSEYGIALFSYRLGMGPEKPIPGTHNDIFNLINTNIKQIDDENIKDKLISTIREIDNNDARFCYQSERYSMFYLFVGQTDELIDIVLNIVGNMKLITRNLDEIPPSKIRIKIGNFEFTEPFVDYITNIPEVAVGFAVYYKGTIIDVLGELSPINGVNKKFKNLLNALKEV